LPVEFQGKKLSAELEFEEIPFKIEIEKVSFSVGKQDG